MAKKHKKSRRKQRHNFLRTMKSLAAGLYWFASFILVLLNIITMLKNW